MSRFITLVQSGLFYKMSPLRFSPAAALRWWATMGRAEQRWLNCWQALYDPTKGAILLDGRDLSDYDVAALQANIGVIFQDFVRYQVTAQENIGFGRVEEVDALTRIMAAANKGGAVPVIEKLPNGYQTMLGDA